MSLNRTTHAIGLLLGLSLLGCKGPPPSMSKLDGQVGDQKMMMGEGGTRSEMGGGGGMMGGEGGGMMGGEGGMMGGGGTKKDGGATGDGIKPADKGPSSGIKVGDVCDATTKCPAGGSGTAVCRTTWPNGGYCLVEGCSDHGHDCPGDPGLGGTVGDSKCVLAPTALCLKMCKTDAECRTGYACVSKGDAAGHGTATVCVPKS